MARRLRQYAHLAGYLGFAYEKAPDQDHFLGVHQTRAVLAAPGSLQQPLRAPVRG